MIVDSHYNPFVTFDLPSISEIPWPFRIFGVLFFAQFIPGLWRAYQKKQTETWPVADGRIEKAIVENARRTFSFSRSKTDNFLAELFYTYNVGELFSGQSKLYFETEEEAEEFIRDLEGKRLAVRYNPEKPEQSAISDIDIQTLVLKRPPAPSGTVLGKASKIPSWAAPLLWPLLALSAAGFSISLWAHINALAGRNVLPEGDFVLMHLGIFVVWFPAVLISMGLPRPPKKIGSGMRPYTFFPGVPPLIQAILFVLFAYAMFNFFATFGFGKSKSDGNNVNANTVRGFSGHWMLFYFAAFTMFLAALNAVKNSPRCTNRHRVVPGDSYCKKCGSPILTPRDSAR